MTPECLMAAVVALRASLSEKIAELEEDPQWNTGDEREELVLISTITLIDGVPGTAIDGRR
jgi:hypothetical protein